MVCFWICFHFWKMFLLDMEDFSNPKFCILEMSFIFLMSPATSEKESVIIHIFGKFSAISSQILLVPHSLIFFWYTKYTYIRHFDIVPLISDTLLLFFLFVWLISIDLSLNSLILPLCQMCFKHIEGEVPGWLSC